MQVSKLKSVCVKDDFCGYFVHESSMSMVAFDWKGMTSYWCSIVSLGVDRIAVQLYAFKSRILICNRIEERDHLQSSFQYCTETES